MSILIFDLEEAEARASGAESRAEGFESRAEGAEACGIGHQLTRLTDWRLAPLEWRRFEDGEFKLRPLCEVRDQRVIVVARAATSSVHDRLVAVGLLLSALRRQRPSELVLVLPCLPYARKDRTTQARDPLSLQWMARMLSLGGLSSVWTFEPHEPAAAENAFDCPVHVLSMADWLALTLHRPALESGVERAVDVVASPDAGGVRRALAVRARISEAGGQSLGFALMDKHREAGVLSGDPRVVGEVAGLRVLVVDDQVVSGASLARAVLALRQAGALEVHALLGHGRPDQAVYERLQAAGLQSMVVSDSLAWPADEAAARPMYCEIRSMVPLLARRLQEVLTPGKTIGV
jgi:ribose-phosphate pyrophosphokinase